MIIQLNKNISKEEKSNITSSLNNISYKTKTVNTQYKNYLIGIGNNDFDIRKIGNMPGVEDIHKVSMDYKLVSRKWRVDDTIIDLGDNISINRNDLTIMAGPCSIESEEHAMNIIEHLEENDIRIMRTMVFKPRSSPYSFRGLGIEGLRTISAECKKRNIKIISEVMEVSQVEAMHDYVDIFQVGTRNTQNFNLLDALGKVDKAVMIKRGISGTIDELLQSAEYVFSNGNEKILLCERGIRSFEKSYRNTFDLNAIPILKDKTHLPVIADPSHSIGIRKHVEKMALAAIMAGADGIITEVHQQPEKAFSDGQQTLNYPEAKRLYFNAREINVLKRNLL